MEAISRKNFLAGLNPQPRTAADVLNRVKPFVVLRKYGKDLIRREKPAKKERGR